MTRHAAFFVLVAIQVLCALIFLLDILLSMFGLYDNPIAWTTRETMEMGAGIGLLLGMGFGAVLAWRSFGELKLARARIDRAAGAFADVLAARFDEWNLTAAERDVALFAIKGLPLNEIAQMRATSEGTVKAQTTAIYRKAGVSGRPQLLSLFIEDMMGAQMPAHRSVPGRAA